MVYQVDDMKVKAFVDFDYAGDSQDRKSMSGSAVKLGSATCISSTKPQPTVTLSTCEAEYHAMAIAAEEIIWITRVLQEAGFDIENPTPISSDNTSAIDWLEAE